MEEELTACEFFIAPHGNGMPHCHNCLEAMNKGVIPITNYAEWFYPRLENGVNCLEFSDEESLIMCIRRVLTMTKEKMHKEVERYYNEYCSSNSVYNKVFEGAYKRERRCMLCNDEGNSIRLRMENMLLQE